MDIDEAIDAYYAGEYRGAYNAFSRLAAQGDPRAQLGLAGLYRQGDVPERDRHAAPYWFEQAARQGNATAAFMIGSKVAYFSDKQRLHWLRESVGRSYPIAIAQLGRVYPHGWLGVKPDHERDRQILMRAARSGKLSPAAMNASIRS